MHNFRFSKTRAAVGLVAGVSFAGAVSCSPSSGTSTIGGGSPNGGAGSDPGSGSSSSSGSTNGSSGSDNGSGGSGIFNENGGSAGSNPLTGDAACQTEVHQGERQPLDMYFIVDQSGSMNEGSPSKWTAVSGSLQAFLADPVNNGTGAGIGYFPTGTPACNAQSATCTCIPFINICFPTGGGSCNASDYSKPDVGIAVLPGVSPTINTSLGAHGPNGGTPTYPALQGTYTYATQWSAAHPDRRTVVVLATDGDPTGCDNTNQVGNATTKGTIAGDLVAPAYAGNPTANPPVRSISTFVIGVGSSLTSLNALAAAGGTKQAFIVDTGGDVAKQFAAALDQIRGQAVSCDFAVPSDGSVDSTKVNATYTPAGSANASDIFNVADATKCDSKNQDWYFNGDKSQISLCPNVCQTLASGGTVQVVLGCPTKIQIIQ
jgi:hypothetical protein